MDAPPVQYVKTSDGYDIAYTVRGEGQPLVLLPVRFSNVQTIWRHYPDFVAGLAERFRLVCFDGRGGGMSTRDLPEDSAMRDFDIDVEAVVDLLGEVQVILLAVGRIGHLAVRYAANHPQRVKALILHTATIRNEAWPLSLYTGLAEENWRQFVNQFAALDGTREGHRRRLQDYEAWIDPRDWATQSRVMRPSDVSAELPRLTIPTLVTHAKDFLSLPVEESMKFVASVPNGRLVVIEGDSGLGEASSLLTAVDSFVASLALEGPATERISDDLHDGLSERELEVLRLLAQGKSNPQIAEALFISRNTVQNHVSSILIKTNLTNRAQAAVYAQQHGIV